MNEVKMLPGPQTRRRFLASIAAIVPAFVSAEEKKSDLPISGKADEKYARIDEFMTDFVTKFKVPGAAVAVAKDGTIVYSRGFGWADRENKSAMKPDAIFRIASMSKPFTAVAVMRLVEKGKLKLDDRVAETLSIKPAGQKADERWKKITIRHLLEHRGGWDHSGTFDPMFASVKIAQEVGVKAPAMPPTIIHYMLHQPLDFDPGDRFAYTNFGYCLLGRVIESVSGDSYEAHIKKVIVEPLKLGSLRLAKTFWADRAKGEVRYYSSDPAKAVMGPQFGKPVAYPYGGCCLESMDAHGGWLASAPDLVTFSSSFADPKRCKLLSAESVEMMFARPDGEKGESYYARGWQVQPDGKERRNYWHGGSMSGSSGGMVRRADGVAFAVLMNTREKVNGVEPSIAIGRSLNQTLNAVFR
jgi:N-acyl-D-amino-acid deacylase